MHNLAVSAVPGGWDWDCNVKGGIKTYVANMWQLGSIQNSAAIFSPKLIKSYWKQFHCKDNSWGLQYSAKSW